MRFRSRRSQRSTKILSSWSRPTDRSQSRIIDSLQSEGQPYLKAKASAAEGDPVGDDRHYYESPDANELHDRVDLGLTPTAAMRIAYDEPEFSCTRNSRPWTMGCSSRAPHRPHNVLWRVRNTLRHRILHRTSTTTLRLVCGHRRSPLKMVGSSPMALVDSMRISGSGGTKEQAVRSRP